MPRLYFQSNTAAAAGAHGEAIAAGTPSRRGAPTRTAASRRRPGTCQDLKVAAWSARSGLMSRPGRRRRHHHRQSPLWRVEVAYAAEAGAMTARPAPHLSAGRRRSRASTWAPTAARPAGTWASWSSLGGRRRGSSRRRGSRSSLSRSSLPPPLSPLSRVRRGPYCGRHDGLREPAPTNLRTHRFRARTGGQRGRTGTDAAGTWRRASAPVARAPGSRKVRLRGGDELWKPAPTPTRSLTLPTSSLPHKNFGKRELTAPPAGAAVVPA